MESSLSLKMNPFYGKYHTAWIRSADESCGLQMTLSACSLEKSDIREK